MEFYEVLDQVVALLQQRSRVTYRTLKREFQLDEERLDDLKEELLYAHPEVMDDEGRGLVWAGAMQVSGSSLQVAGSKGEDQKQETRNEKPIVSSQSPIAYTPSHLAE